MLTHSHTVNYTNITKTHAMTPVVNQNLYIYSTNNSVALEYLAYDNVPVSKLYTFRVNGQLGSSKEVCHIIHKLSENHELLRKRTSRHYLDC